jgi:hypothetical protein
MNLSLIFRAFLVTCLLMLSLAASPPIPALAAILTVSNCNDSGSGSLRQAVLNATDGDTIQFSLDCPDGAPITLASAISIDKNLTLSGQGRNITISGDNSTRIFEITAGKTVRLEYLTLMNANGGENENGGAILDGGSHLTIVNVTFKNNRLTGSAGNKGGGAIAHRGGSDSSLTIEKSRFEDNSTQNLGGAIFTSPPTTITDTTFSGNVAYRGTVMSYSGQSLTVERSTFNDNVIIKNTDDFPGAGGAIYFGMGTLQVKNSTFSGNGSDIDANQGGAIFTYGSANVLIWNSTFTGNKIWDSNGYYKGGGIHITSTSMLSYYNNILAGNSPDDCALEDSAIAQNINNLVQVGSGCGTPLLTSVPLLGPLQDNGGFTHTHALLSGSPAIDSGDNDSCLATDQRGVARPQGAVCDIGAYEYQTPSIEVFSGGVLQGTYAINPGDSQRLEYAGLNNGPVVVSSASDVLSSIRVLYKGVSYSEMLGFPAEEITNEYWFPVYDSATLNSQLRIGNLGSESTTITVYLGDGEELDSFTLGANAAIRKNYTGQNGGPLRVVSSATDILVSVRLLYGDSYTEELGFPADQLTTDYWFPWYNNVAFPSELRVANTGGVVANVTVYIGDNDVLDTFSIPVGEAVRVSYAGENNGPLRVVTSSSSILPSIRVIYKGISYSEMLGLPNSKLTNEYWLPAYDSTSVNSQLRIGNVGGQSTTITVYLGDGEVLDSFTLGVGEAVRKNYTGEDGGPLRVVSSASNVLVTNRILLVTASYETYYELLAYPDDSLSGELWFPWYNNLAFPSELRIAVP